MQSNLCYAKIKNYPNKIIKAGSFTLEYGQYKGIETDYDHQIHEIKAKEVFATLTKNKIIINCFRKLSTKTTVKSNAMRCFEFNEFVYNKLTYKTKAYFSRELLKKYRTLS